MSQTPMVLPRTHLGSSQNSKSEAICPGLEIQTKSILCTLAFQPNPYGSSQNSSWVIPDLNVWGNLSWTRNTNKVNTLHPGLWAKPLWFFQELILGHPRSQYLRKPVQEWKVNKAKTLHTVLWAKPYGSSKKASRYSKNLCFQKTYHRLGKGPKRILCSLANEPNPYGSSQNSS